MQSGQSLPNAAQDLFKHESESAKLESDGEKKDDDLQDVLIRGGPNPDDETVVLTDNGGNSQTSGEKKDDDLEDALVRGRQQPDNETLVFVQ